MVKKAVIAAAGRGTRFLPVTKAYPKELLPILDKPIIQYQVEELLGAGIKQIAIVHRHGNQAIKRYFGADPDLDQFLTKNGKQSWLADLKKIRTQVSFRFIPQPRRLAYGTGSPVLAAKSFINQQPFAYFYGDDLVLEKKPGLFISQLISVFEKHRAAIVLGAQEVPWNEVERYGSVKFKKGGRISYQVESVEEGLPAGKAPSNFVQFGRFVVSPAVISLLATQKLSKTKELFFTDVVKKLAQEKVVIARPIKHGKWLTTGDPERWLQANLEFKQFFSGGE